MPLSFSARLSRRARVAIALTPWVSLVACARAEPLNTAPTPIDPVGLAAVQARERAQDAQSAPEPPRAMWRAPSIDASVTAPLDTREDAASADRAPIEDAQTPDAQALAQPEPTRPPPDFVLIHSALQAQLSRRDPPTLVAVQNARRGLGYPFDHRALLELRGRRYVGRVRCEYRSHSAWQELSVSRQELLAQLDDVPSIALHDEQYHANALSTESRPMRVFALHFQGSSVEFVSWSQTRDGAPWGAREGASSSEVDWSATIAASGDAISASYLRLLTVSGIDRCEAFVQCVNAYEYRSTYLRPVRRSALVCPGFRVASSPRAQREASEFGREHFH
jgi:hypothetical protein